MKKYYSNICTLAALLIAGAAFIACSNDDKAIEQPVYTFTINTSKDAGTSTRALNLVGEELVASWETTDIIYVSNGVTNLGTLSPTNIKDGWATFSGKLTGEINVGDVLTLSYHPVSGMSDFGNQDGTLKGTEGAEKYDMAVATVTVDYVEDGKVSTDEDAVFETKTAMIKFTMIKSDETPINATSLSVSVTIDLGFFSKTQKDVFTFTPAANAYTVNGDGILYLALPDKAALSAKLAEKFSMSGQEATIEGLINSESTTITFTASDGINNYSASKKKYPFEGGKYYSSTLTMTPVE